MSRHRLVLVAFTAFTSLAVRPAAAQTTTGRISGTVVDSSGAVLPGATVTATHEQTQLAKSATTDKDGAFLIVSLPNGTYSVAAEMPGFRKQLKTGYQLVADGRLTADFTLPVGQMSEVVEVTVAGETVNTTSGEIARVVDREQVQNMALNGRNYMQLATLIPGSPLLNDNALDIMTGLGIGTSINGGRGNTSLLTVDGGFNMDSGSNNSQISNVGIDFIEEVSIKTANFSAEYGRNSGANINVVTRSGSNDFHGSLYEYHRNEGLDANNYFSNARSVARSALSYNDFGWTLGGPIMKNKLFFFGGQEWKRIRRDATPKLLTLPTRAMRSGNFSGITTVLRDPLTGQPFPGNIIPASRITADGRAIAGLYTAMEQTASSYDDRPVGQNALFEGDNPFDWRQDVIRLDFQASDAHRLTLRVIYDNYDLVDPFGVFIGDANSLPTIPTNRTRPGRNWQVGHAWTVSPAIVNEFKVNASWNSQRIPPVGDAWERETYGFAYPQLFDNDDRFESSIPDMTIQGYATAYGAARSLISPTTDIQFSDNLTWLKGAHTLKVGAHRRSQPQGPERTHALHRLPRVRFRRQHPGHRQRLRRRAPRQLPALHRIRLRPRGLLPVLAGRGLRLRRLAPLSQPQHRGRPPLHVAPAHLHPGEQHGELRPCPLQPGAGDDRQSQRHARSRIRRPLQRHDPGGRGSARGGAVPRPRRRLRHACWPCRPARPAACIRTATCSRPASASPGRPRAAARWRCAAASASSTTGRKGTCCSGAAATGR